MNAYLRVPLLAWIWIGGSPLNTNSSSRHAGAISGRIAEASVGGGGCGDAVGIRQHHRRWRIGPAPVATMRGSSRE